MYSDALFSSFQLKKELNEHLFLSEMRVSVSACECVLVHVSVSNVNVSYFLSLMMHDKCKHY